MKSSHHHCSNKDSKNKKKEKRHHRCYCFEEFIGPQGPPGIPGKVGPTGPIGISLKSSELSESSKQKPINFPFIINKQNKITDVLDIDNPNEEVVISITINIPETWLSYDLILSGELFADGTDIDTGVIISFRKDKSVEGELIGSQIIGHNNTDSLNGIGFVGYHKEILIDQTITGLRDFCLTVKAINMQLDIMTSISVINRYIYIQAICQKYKN